MPEDHNELWGESSTLSAFRAEVERIDEAGELRAEFDSWLERLGVDFGERLEVLSLIDRFREGQTTAGDVDTVIRALLQRVLSTGVVRDDERAVAERMLEEVEPSSPMKDLESSALLEIEYINPVLSSDLPPKPLGLQEWFESQTGRREDAWRGFFDVNPSLVNFIVGPGALKSGAADECIETMNVDGLGERSRDYVNALYADRKGDRSLTASLPASDLLDEFRRELVDLASNATLFFNKKLGARLASEESTVRLQASIKKVLKDRKRSLNDLAQPQRVEALRDSLGRTEFELLGCETVLEQVTGWIAYVENRDSLTGGDLQWLADVVWHTIVFRSQLYPTVEELVAQASILLKERPEPYRHWPPPSRLGLPESSSELSEVVAKCVKRGNRHNSAREQFYDALAGVLWAQHDYGERRRESHKERRSESRSSTEHSGSADELVNIPEMKKSDVARREVWPTVFVLTPDVEVEKALIRQRHSWARRAGAEGGSTVLGSRLFHVLIPVVDPSRKSEGATVLRWLLGTYDENREDPLQPMWSLAEDSEDKIDGPIIVKVAGSPLHPLPMLRQPESKAVALLHAVDVGESLFMNFGLASQVAQIVRWAIEHKLPTAGGGSRSAVLGAPSVQALPAWLLAGLWDTPPLWWLFGVRLSDWVGRFQLFLQLRLLEQGGSRKLGSFAFNKTWHDDRDARVLAMLGIGRVEAECCDLLRPLDYIRDRYEVAR